MERSLAKITGHQLYALTACGAIGGALNVIASTITAIAKQNSWIVAIVSPLLGLPVIWLYCFLGSRYPDLTLIGIIRKIFGRWVGTIISILYIFVFLLIGSNIPWYIGSFVGHIMHETPTYVINFVFIAAAVIAILYGIETIARAFELFIVIISVVFFVSMALVAPNIKPIYIMPVLEDGFIPVLKGTLFLSSFVTFPLITLMTIYPINVSAIPDGKKALFKGFLWSSLIIFVAIILSVLVLGSTITAKSNYPTLFLAREISVGTLFTRLEYGVSTIWIISQLCACLLMLYSGIIGISELLVLRNYRKIVVPIGFIALIMSQVNLKNPIYQANWVVTGYVPMMVTFSLILPLLLLVIYLIKKWAFKKT